MIATPAITPRPENLALRVTIGSVKRMVAIAGGPSIVIAAGRDHHLRSDPRAEDPDLGSRGARGDPVGDLEEDAGDEEERDATTSRPKARRSENATTRTANV